MHLLEVAMNLLLCGFRLFMFCWTRYRTDLADVEEKTPKNWSKWTMNVGNFL